MHIGDERLLKLADHLERGKLGHNRFNFATYCESIIGPQGVCGTMGCAIGECPTRCGLTSGRWMKKDYLG